MAGLGYNDDVVDIFDDFEVIDAETNANCLFSTPFPHENIGAEIAVLDGKVRICGGYKPDDAVMTDECFELREDGLVWNVENSLRKARGYAASGVLSTGEWIIAGGNNLFCTFTWKACHIIVFLR